MRIANNSSMMDGVEQSALAVTRHFICCCPEHKAALFELVKTPFDEGMKHNEYKELATAKESLSAREVSKRFCVMQLGVQNNQVVFHTFSHFCMTQNSMHCQDKETFAVTHK